MEKQKQFNEALEKKVSNIVLSNLSSETTTDGEVFYIVKDLQNLMYELLVLVDKK